MFVALHSEDCEVHHIHCLLRLGTFQFALVPVFFLALIQGMMVGETVAHKQKQVISQNRTEDIFKTTLRKSKQRK